MSGESIDPPVDKKSVRTSLYTTGKNMKCIYVLVATVLTFAQASETRLVDISVSDQDDVYTLCRQDITIVDVTSHAVRAVVDDHEISRLKTAGFAVTVIRDDYQAYKNELFERGFYHTYEEVYAVLDSFVNDYPGICRLDTVGFSVQGRAIWAMRVTDNPSIEETESEIRLIGNMHGDEHIGTEVTLYFLRYLLVNYGGNSQVQQLVNNREFWIVPTMNPDGKVANTRNNANSVDLNRDYGFFWSGWGGSPSPNSQIENQVMIQHLDENDVVLEYNYHSAAEYVNYPWDYHQADPPDSQLFIDLSTIYAAATDLTVTNGYDWYQVTGSLQDYTTGTTGALAWTIETLEPSGSSAIDQICYDNRDALLQVCDRAGWGIEGFVKDSLTNVPLRARIEFSNPDRMCIYSDPYNGDFHKMIEPGTYDVTVFANGYTCKCIDSVVVPATDSIALGDVYLVPDSSARYAFQVVLCRFRNHDTDDNKTRPRYALGPPDSQFFSLGQNGYIVLDMGETPIVDIPGNDFVVYEGDDGLVEGYYVYVSNSWTGPWLRCDSAGGTASFDIASTGLSEARYIRVIDDADYTSGQYAGFDCDAVQSFSPIGIEEQEVCTSEEQWSFNLSPNPFRNSTVVLFPASSRQHTVGKLNIFNITGQLVRSFDPLPYAPSATQIVWDGTDDAGKAVPAGVYFVQCSSGEQTRVAKAVLLR
jgi:hypothetical protein